MKNLLLLTIWCGLILSSSTAWALKLPASLAATAVSTSQVDLSFVNRATRGNGLIIERSLKQSSGFAEIARVPKEAVKYSNVNLSASTLYYYRMKAYRLYGNRTIYSGYSNIASAKTLAPPAQPAPLVPAPTPTPPPMSDPLPPTLAGSGLIVDLNYVNRASTQYSRFKSYVDSKVNGGNPYGFSGVDAGYMFKLSNENKYCTLAVATAEAQVQAAEAAIAANGVPEVAGDSYLHVGAKIAEVAVAYDWCSSFLSSAQRTRYENYARQTIFNVWNPSSAKWGSRSSPWSGWSIDNPGNNYFYSFTMATMYWGLASNDSVTKSLARQKFEMIHAYFSQIPGGGSLEGTGYGTAHMNLFDLYNVWKDSTGEDYANRNSHLTQSINYWVHATTPNRQRFASIGDQARVSEPQIYDYQRRLVLHAKQNTSSAAAQDLASWWLNHISLTQMSSGFNSRYDLIDAGNNTAAAPNSGLIYQAQGVGQLFARTGWDTGALWMQFTAGKYNESHAHQDQGSFTLAAADWLTVTANIYSHSGINQVTDVHNLVRFVNGTTTIPQREGTTSSIVINSQSASSGAVNATANLTPAYAGNANIQAWNRNIDFSGRRLRVTDNFTVTSTTKGIFQVNVPVPPVVSGNIITAGGLTITVLAPASPNVVISNWRDSSVDTFSDGYKIEISGATGSGQFIVEMNAP